MPQARTTYVNLNSISSDAMKVREHGNSMTPQPSTQLSSVSGGAPGQESYVCWSRMQAEAGHALEKIIQRKEYEREAGGGQFFWGVGNPPSTAIASLSRLKVPVRVIFSVMKSKPKSIDISPSRTVVWRKYYDEHGVERCLPPHALITSRGDSASGPKLRHYALMCRLNERLELRQGEGFDPAAYRNLGKDGGPVGASQVTALLRQVETPAEATDYRVNLAAWLTGGYWVRLSDPWEITPEINSEIAAFRGPASRWLELARHVRGPIALGSQVATDNFLLL